MTKRIDQFLFKNIVRQAYEAQKAWNDWLSEYSNQSQSQKEVYQFFSGRTRRKLESDLENLELHIFNIWDNLTEEEQKKWEEQYLRQQLKFRDVAQFLEMFNHYR